METYRRCLWLGLFIISFAAQAGNKGSKPVDPLGDPTHHSKASSRPATSSSGSAPFRSGNSPEDLRRVAPSAHREPAQQHHVDPNATVLRATTLTQPDDQEDAQEGQDAQEPEMLPYVGAPPRTSSLLSSRQGGSSSSIH